MNSSLMTFVELDVVCIVVFVCLMVNTWKSGDKSRNIYIAVQFIVCTQAVLDLVLKVISSINCYSLYSKNEVCSKGIEEVVFFSCALSFFNLLVPFVIFVRTYLLNAEYSRTRELRLVILSIPFLVVEYLTVTSPVNGYIQFLTYHGAYVHGKYYSVLVGTVGFYSVLAFANIVYLISARRGRIIEFALSRIDLAIFYLTSILPFVLAPVTLLTNINLVSPSYAVCLFFLMTLHQHMRISIDDLTSLNNRNELKNYLLNLMSLDDQERKTTYMVFIDVNKFKSINDNYGHNEGDVVLMQLSRILKNVAENFNCFLCRYGGDEFILIKRNANDERAAGVCKYINKAVERLRVLSLAPYELSVSTGYVRFDKRFKSTKDFIDAADRLMYETKRSSKKDYSMLKKDLSE
ncbi:MAG: GGDEF domain-containing protein [Succinivibrio sp.]